MRILFDKTGQTPEEWQKFRKSMNGIGGSDCAVIMGLSPFKSPFSLWLEKTGQVKAKNLDNEYIEWGNLLEPVIRDKFRRETGFEVSENPFVLQHDEFDWMLANVDGELIDPAFGGEKGILEIKTTSERHKKEWDLGPPDYYMLQIQHYLGVTGYKYAYVAVLIGGHEFKYFKIDRDDYVIDRIIAAEKEFWDMVQNDLAPEIREVDSTALAEAYPEDDGETALLPPELEELAEKYWDTQKQIKLLEDSLETIKNKIKFQAKENKYLRGVHVKVAMPTISKVLFDQKRFSQEMPEIYEKYKTKQSSYRGFTVKMVDE
jgi:putative phage-type endonuclease